MLAPFPDLLRRRTFFDLQLGNAERGVKRWLWQQERDPSESARLMVRRSGGLLCAGLADRPGEQTSSAELARRFARQAEGEFECVLWLPCHGRSLVECTGELSVQLGLEPDGPERENRRRVAEILALRRCLVVLDAPANGVRSALTFQGRSSTLATAEPLELRETPRTFSFALGLVRTRRLAEAYDLLYTLLEEAVEPGACGARNWPGSASTGAELPKRLACASSILRRPAR